MINREGLISVMGEQFAKELNAKNDNELKLFKETLHNFITDFPNHEFDIRKAFNTKDMEGIQESFHVLWGLFIKIHADDMAYKCHLFMDSLKKKSLKQIEADINEFIAEVTKLSIDIQMTIDEEEPPAVTLDDSGIPVEPGTILAVDDTVLYLRNMRSFLSETEYRLTCLPSGELAMQFIEKHRPALFILDIIMPEMDGFELAENIRKAGHTAPIIFLTASASKDSVIKARQLGAAGFIIKPASKEQVLEMIEKHI